LKRRDMMAKDDYHAFRREVANDLDQAIRSVKARLDKKLKRLKAKVERKGKRGSS
jgi:hypothetical protein